LEMIKNLERKQVFPYIICFVLKITQNCEKKKKFY
jgi:hypothetical protein